MIERRPHIAGMILAAGYGERMLPITAALPKALLPVLGVPLIEIIVRKLLREGARDIHCNLHHLPDAIERFAGGKDWPLTFHREPEILGTAGGIGNMSPSVAGADCILLHNGDIIADIGFAGALASHRARGALVTLVLVPRGPVRNVAVAETGEVTGIGDRCAGSGTLLGYAGMAVLSPEAFAFFPRGKKAGLVDTLNDLIGRRPGSVAGWNAAAGTPYAWGDCGSPASYLEVHRLALVEKTVFDPLIEPPAASVHAGAEAVIEAGVKFYGFCEIGPRAVIGRASELENCVVLSGARVPPGGRHQNEILYPEGSLKG